MLLSILITLSTSSHVMTPNRSEDACVKVFRYAWSLLVHCSPVAHFTFVVIFFRQLSFGAGSCKTNVVRLDEDRAVSSFCEKARFYRVSESQIGESGIEASLLIIAGLTATVRRVVLNRLQWRRSPHTKDTSCRIFSFGMMHRPPSCSRLLPTVEPFSYIAVILSASFSLSLLDIPESSNVSILFIFPRRTPILKPHFTNDGCKSMTFSLAMSSSLISTLHSSCLLLLTGSHDSSHLSSQQPKDKPQHMVPLRKGRVVIPSSCSRVLQGKSLSPTYASAAGLLMLQC